MGMVENRFNDLESVGMACREQIHRFWKRVGDGDAKESIGKHGNYYREKEEERIVRQYKMSRAI